MTFEETKSNIEAVVVTPLLDFRGKAAPLNQIHNDAMREFANVMSGLLTGSDGETEFQGPGSMALANLIGSYLTTEQSITGSGTDFIGHLLEASQESEKIAHQLQQELNSIAVEQDNTVKSAGGLAVGLDAGAAAQGGLDVPWDVVAIGASLVAAGLAATYNPDQAKVQKAEMAKYIAITEWSGKIEGIAAEPLPQLTPSPSKPNGDTSDFQKMIGLGVLAAALEGDNSQSSKDKTFPNTLPERLEEEQALAKELGVTPVQVGGQGFDEAINEGTVKWVVTVDGELWIIPKHVNEEEIAHSVITNGGDVIAAGEADIAGSSGQYVGIEITNHSGHYLPNESSLEIAKKIFKSHGITFP